MQALQKVLEEARTAAKKTALLSTTSKRVWLTALATMLREQRAALLVENGKDLAAARAQDMSEALVDRLTLTGTRIESLATTCETIAALPDPVGLIESPQIRADGLYLARMRVPLGVIALVYEARPNVTVEAAALCVMSGNACVLRGGREAQHSNRALISLVHAAANMAGIDPNTVTFLPPGDRDEVRQLAQATGLVDLLIPRGGEGLIRFVQEHARVPLILHYKGVCHIYVDESADPNMAAEIVYNAKVQRPGVCNAVETVLLHHSLAARCGPLLKPLLEAGVELRVDNTLMQNAPATMREKLVPATDADWDTEYLSLVLSLRCVSDFDEALSHIARHGSGYTEAIVTEDVEQGERFLRQVDASLVLVNASTRFNDGAELGLGAEMGISTSKLHAYGAMGLRELTTQKWIARGTGHTRT